MILQEYLEDNNSVDEALFMEKVWPSIREIYSTAKPADQKKGDDEETPPPQDEEEEEESEEEPETPPVIIFSVRLSFLKALS